MKTLVVLWESQTEPRTLLADNPRQANTIAASLRASRRRRVDVVPLNSTNLKRLTS